MSKILDIFNSVIEIESVAIANLKSQLSSEVESAVDALYSITGKVILVGMGKSGIIANKIAATLASTGTPSFFMHPSEAYHGDLGMISKDDAVILISNSGETDEVLRLIPHITGNVKLIISMTGKPDSTLAINSDYNIDISVQHEACPLQLAPTSSTTATLVMGDAIAVALMELRGFSAEDFAQYHPGGSLGRRLLTTASSVMRSDNLPVCHKTSMFSDVVNTMTNGKLGIVIVVDKEVEGVITDGDLRRAMEAKMNDVFDLSAVDIMHSGPISVEPACKLTDVEKKFVQNKINSILVTENNQLLGVVQIYDIGL